MWIVSWQMSCYSFSEPWLLTVGALQIQCTLTGNEAVARLAVSRGLLTCCRPHILLSSRVDATEVNLPEAHIKNTFHFSSSSFKPITSFSPQMCLLLNGLFPLVYTLCEEKLGLSPLCLRRWVMSRCHIHVLNCWCHPAYLTCCCSVGTVAEEG